MNDQVQDDDQVRHAETAGARRSSAVPPGFERRGTGQPAPGSSFAGGDIVPLNHRVTTLSVVRTAICVALLAAAAIEGRLDHAVDVVLPLGYLVLAALLSAAALLITHRTTAVAWLGLVLCADGVALQCAQHLVGQFLPVQVAVGTYLVTVCLLVSFRTGLKLVIWQSLLVGIDDQGIQVGLFDTPSGRRADRAVPELIMLWTLVLVVCVAASVSERELRRRRHDAEAMQVFATALHRDDEPLLVLRRTLAFVVEQLDAGRALICGRQDGRLTLLAAHGLAIAPVAGATARSAGVRPASDEPDAEAAAAEAGLLASAEFLGRPALLFSLDRARDPWLEALLPGARRLIVLPLGADAHGDPLWLVLEHQGRTGGRVERRVLATAGQVSATAALALSRAVLFQQARAQATTDALTGLANRRTFDERFGALSRQLPARRFGVLLGDVDWFKSVNDTYGHQVGDLVLQAVAATLAEGAPPGALVARYGGEEFAVLLPGAGTSQTLAAAEALRTAVEGLREPVPVTASFGAAVSGSGAGPEELLALADAALYRAKAEGRNAVRLGEPADLTTAGPAG